MMHLSAVDQAFLLLLIILCLGLARAFRELEQVWPPPRQRPGNCD